jgi:hypothetical protein
MSNYARRQPIDESQSTIQNAATPFPARVTWNIANGVASSVINLNPNTTRLEISAVGGQGAAIKWIPLTDSTSASVVSSGLSANFDNFIPAGTMRHFVVPRETAGVPTNPNVQIGSIQGLYQRVAWINAGITASSILANEY